MTGRSVTKQGKSGRRGHGMTWQGRAGQGRAVQSRVGKGEGNTKDNAGLSTLQEKAKGITDCSQGGRQGRAD